MYAFAFGLIATYVALGILVAVTMRLSHAAFAHMPGWSVGLVLFGIGGLWLYMLAIGNLLAIFGAITVGFCLTVLAMIRALTLVVPGVGDAGEALHKRDRDQDPDAGARHERGRVECVPGPLPPTGHELDNERI